MEKIFVSIASLKDSELLPTINDALDKAIHPDRIHFGVFLQDKEENKDILSNIPNCKVLFINYKDAKGPGYARNKIAKELFSNEDYFLQIDSHSRFLEGWDSLLIKTIKKFDGKVCLTGFPDKYYPSQTYNEYSKDSKITHSIIQEINDNYLITKSTRTIFNQSFKETISISAAFLFSDSNFVKSTIHDFEDIFYDQEIISCLGYINGYTFYVPNQNFIFHLYNDIPEFEDRFKFSDLNKESKNADVIHNLKNLKVDRTFDDWLDRVNDDIHKSNKKYVSFEPWNGGFSNIRQSYETIGAISIITGRTIILPPKIYCLFFSEYRNKNTFIDMFDAIDEEAFKAQFDCVDYYDVPEYVHLENQFGYFDSVSDIATCIEFNNGNGKTKDPLDKYFLHYGNTNSLDFTYFKNGRTGIDLEINNGDKFIHFSENLFTQFYYHIYSDLDTRNLIRDKVKNGVKFKSRFFKLAEKVKENLGNYNAIHIRRNDFLHVRTEKTEFQLDYLLDNIKKDFSYDLPLYIATDETDKTLFYFLKDYYNIKFLDNFYKSISEFDSMVVEQIICAQSEVFYGSELSTFTHYIHVMRGYMGKPDYHRVGTNYNYGELKYKHFPWLIEHWEWGRIYDLYWKNESDKTFNDIEIFNLGVYGSHNGAIAISKNDEILEVVELEKWCGIKNAAFWPQGPPMVPKNAYQLAKDIHEYFSKKYGVLRYDKVFHNHSSNELINLFDCNQRIHVPHHLAHSFNNLYQSEARYSLNVSFDGGSEMGFFHIYLLSKDGEETHLYEGNRDLGVAYMILPHYLEDIKQESDWNDCNLVYPGKVMGLSAYGESDDELLKKFRIFYEQIQSHDIFIAHNKFKEIFEINDSTRIGGELSKNMARCNQIVFEELFSNIVDKFIDFYKNYKGIEREVQFSGGGAMNILNNSKYDAFVSPNCDDRGMALGCLLYGIRPNKVIDSTYLGSEPYDELPEHEPYSVSDVLDDLIDGKILGLIQGRAEHSARSLGNRSIICLPKKGMKEILNEKVKRRESFRPFAPICTLEDAPTYFEFGKHSRWMTHNAKVKDGFEKELGAIIHVDGTARLQTVTKSQNEYIYNLLVGLKERGFPPVLLNTSFNIQGKPILNTYKDAIWMRENTGLDEVITDKFILK